MIGMAKGLRIINSTAEVMIRINRSSLPFHPNDLNFNANSGISETIIADSPIEEPMIIHLSTITFSGCHPKWYGIYSMIRGMDMTHIALAGVGKPLKLSDCRVSTLNFANLKAENIGTKNGISKIGSARRLLELYNDRPVDNSR
jgi:hypothetical protein